MSFSDAVITTLVLFLFSKFTISASFLIIYPFAGELYPTQLRGVGIGTSAYIAGLGLVLIPFINYLVSVLLILSRARRLLASSGARSIHPPRRDRRHEPVRKRGRDEGCRAEHLRKAFGRALIVPRVDSKTIGRPAAGRSVGRSVARGFRERLVFHRRPRRITTPIRGRAYGVDRGRLSSPAGRPSCFGLRLAFFETLDTYVLWPIVDRTHEVLARRQKARESAAGAHCFTSSLQPLYDCFRFYFLTSF